MAELGSFELAFKAKNIYYLAFTEKSLPTPGLEQHFFKNGIERSRKYQSVSHVGRSTSVSWNIRFNKTYVCDVCVHRLGHNDCIPHGITVQKIFFSDPRSRLEPAYVSCLQLKRSLVPLHKVGGQ